MEVFLSVVCGLSPLTSVTSPLITSTEKYPGDIIVKNKDHQHQQAKETGLMGLFHASSLGLTGNAFPGYNSRAYFRADLIASIAALLSLPDLIIHGAE